MIYLLGFILPIISYFWQIYPRLFNRYFGVDVWTLLIEADLIRKNKHRIPTSKITNGFIIGGYFEYPPIFITLLSFLNKKTLEKYQGFISPVFDALQNLLVFFIAVQLTNDVKIAMLAQLFYTFTPVSALENSSLVPRSLGYLMFSISFYSLLFYSNSVDHQTLFLLTGFIFAVLTLLSHKFAAQSLLFICLFFTFIDNTLLYIIVFLCSVLTAIIVTKTYYLRVAKSHIAHIHYWMHNFENRFAHQIYGNLSTNKNPDLMGIIYKLLSKLAPLTLLVSNIWIVFSFFFLFWNFQTPLIFTKMAIWVVFFYVLGTLVLMIKQLRPIGEGYRYLEMTQVPTAILASYLFFVFYGSSFRIYAIIIVVFLLLANAFVIIFMQYKVIIKDKNRSLTLDMKKVFLFINKLSGKPRIMCIPHQMTTMTIYNTKADVLVGFDNDPKTLKLLNDFYPVLKISIPKLAKKYKLNYLLLRESFAKLKDLKIKKPKIVYRAGDNVLVKL